MSPTTVPPRPEPGARLTIGELAALVGVTPRALRHYEAAGLLPEPTRDGAGYRRYGPADVVAAVRVARLRALGMPIAQIAGRTPAEAEAPAQELMALADDLDREIGRLEALRDRIRALAASGSFDRPAELLAHALRAHGRLGRDDELPVAERSAAELVDALHPGGMAGALDQAAGLLADPDRAERLGALLGRFRGLPADAPEEDVDALADAIASLVPRPSEAVAPVDLALMEGLLGDRLNRAQRGVLHRTRARQEREGG